MNLNFTKQFKSNFKNKVRITSGLIVTMLITGNMAMASPAGIINYGTETENIDIDDNFGLAINSNYIYYNDGIAIDSNSTTSNYGIAIDSNLTGTNNGISITDGVVSLGSTSTNHIGSGYSGYVYSSGGVYNINVKENTTTFTGEILDPVSGESSRYILLVGSSYASGSCLHNEGTINILENITGLSETDMFVGLKLEGSSKLHNRDVGFFNVASLNREDIIGLYYSGSNINDYNYGMVNISTGGHGIAYYFSDGGRLNNTGTINADTALIMTSDTNSNTLTNSGTINGDVLMNTSGTNTLTVSNGTINGDIKFSGGGDNFVTYSNVGVSGTGDIKGDDSGYNQITVGGYDIAKNIYDFNVLKVRGSGSATLSAGYELSMNPQKSYTPESGTATGLTVDGTLTLNTELVGNDILVPKIDTYGGDVTVSKTGKIRFYVSGTGSESSYDIIFGGNLATTNVTSDGNLVAGDGTLEYNDELFTETLGWNVTNIDESGTQTVVTLSSKDVYDELKETTQDDKRTQIINILDNDQDILGIHEALSNVSMDDATKVVTELSGEIYGNLTSEYIQTNKMFTGKIVTMMSGPLTLSGERISNFALISTAELSSNIFSPRPNYSFLEGEEKYIQHFDILGTTGRFDRTGVEYDTHGSGFIGITEKVMGKKSSMGLSYGYYDTKNDYDDGSDSKTETFHLGMTHKLYFKKDYMLASHLGTEYSKNDVTREITTLGLQANSDYDSYNVSLGTELNKNIKLNKKVTLVPSIGVGYSRIERDSFTESGSIGLAGLDVEDQGLDSVTSKIGLRFDIDLTDKIVWCVGGAWEHEYADLNKDQEASFKGDANAESFKIQGTNINEDIYSILTGVNFNVNGYLTYRILYSFTKQEDLGENYIDLGVSWKF